MKKWFWIILIIILVFLVLGFLYSQGLINVRWQFLAMILAGFAAPFTIIKNFLAGGNSKTNKLIQRHKDRVTQENLRRDEFDAYIAQKDKKIQDLEAEIVVLENDVENIELEIVDNEEKVNNMTEIDDLQNAFMEGYTDES